MHKTFIAILTIIIVLTISFETQASDWAENWSINGIPLTKFKEAKGLDYLEISAGIGSSIIVHWLGHVAWLEMNGKDWHQSQNGLNEICDSPLTNGEARMFGRAGFLAQLTVGTIIKFTDLNDTYFATGYHIGSFIEIGTYPILHGYEKDDLEMMSWGGHNSKIEHFILTGWSTMLLIDLDK